MPLSSDYFSRWEESLWALLEASPRLQRLTRMGNRIKMVGESNQPIKPPNSGADLPEILLIPASWQAVKGGPTSSSSFGMVQRYQIGIVTDSQRTNQERSINAIKWGVFEAILGGSTATHRLPGCPEVKSVLPIEGNDGYDEEKNPGWTAAITIEIEASIPKSAFNTG